MIVATEMMMSTINSSKPSCADVSDVYFALHHGADYVMLSEENELGKNYLETLKIIGKIIKEFHQNSFNNPNPLTFFLQALLLL